MSKVNAIASFHKLAHDIIENEVEELFPDLHTLATFLEIPEKEMREKYSALFNEDIEIEADIEE